MLGSFFTTSSHPNNAEHTMFGSKRCRGVCVWSALCRWRWERLRNFTECSWSEKLFCLLFVANLILSSGRCSYYKTVYEAVMRIS